MDLRHLRYLIAVADEGQFVRAAAELHVAQSALSQQVRDLEQELGTDLLVRDRRGIVPTPAGEVLIGRARRALAEIEDARAEVARMSGVVSGTLRIGFGSPSGPVPLPETLAELKRRHPAVEIVLRDTTSEEFVQWLREGTLDVAVVSFEPDQLPERIQAALVTHEPIVALLPADHRLARETEVALAMLAAEPLVTYPRGSGVRDTIERAFEDAGLGRPRITAETIDPLATLELVGQGLGSSLVPESVAVHAGREVRAVTLAPPGLWRTITLAWARERRRSPALDAFLSLADGWSAASLGAL